LVTAADGGNRLVDRRYGDERNGSQGGNQIDLGKPKGRGKKTLEVGSQTNRLVTCGIPIGSQKKGQMSQVETTHNPNYRIPNRSENTRRTTNKSERRQNCQNGERQAVLPSKKTPTNPGRGRLDRRRLSRGQSGLLRPGKSGEALILEPLTRKE